MKMRLGKVLLALAVLVPSVVGAQPPALTEAERALIDAVPSESTPEPELHYPVSNEWRHDLWFDAIRDLGGAFLGVGSDQSYTLAAVQNASLIWIVDYDAVVRHVHRMYAVLVPASPSPEALLARFDEGAEDETRALLERELAGDPEQRAVVRAYLRSRARFRAYLGRVSRLEREGAPTSWLSDPALYGRIRALFAAGRVIARTGDVGGTTTLRAVGEATRRLGLPVRVLYFSNAEQFFAYTGEFTTNFESLPTDERSIVLRTFRSPGAPYPRRDSWHYLVEGVTDFRERLALGYRRAAQIVNDAIATGLDPSGASRIDERTRRRDRPRRRER